MSVVPDVHRSIRNLRDCMSDKKSIVILGMGQKTHFYKIPLSSERGKSIKNFLEKGKEAALAAEELAKELGADGHTDCPGRLYPGIGIGSLVFGKRPSSKRYLSIGEGEYIPNMKRKEGMEIAKRIARLPYVTGFDFCVAFGIPVDKKVTPKWYVYDGSVYLSSPYPLGEEYIVITEEVFEKHKEEAE